MLDNRRDCSRAARNLPLEAYILSIEYWRILLIKSFRQSPSSLLSKRHDCLTFYRPLLLVPPRLQIELQKNNSRSDYKRESIRQHDGQHAYLGMYRLLKTLVIVLPIVLPPPACILLASASSRADCVTEASAGGGEPRQGLG